MRDRYALKVAAHLSLAAESVPHDIGERLRVARQQAVGKRKIVKPVTAGQAVMSGGAAALGFGDEGLDLWGRVASALPLIAMVIGLVMIHGVQNDLVANELAAVDAALLVDDLPPAAYADPGFAEFVKMTRKQAQ
ncbi:MAG: DUF3619 family protein [Burkholderiaceae bacterium]